MNSEMESWKLQVSKSEDPAPGSILPATNFVCVGQSLSHSLLMFLILENLSEPMIFFHIQGHYMDKWSESIMLVLYVLVIFITSKFLSYQMKWISLSRYIFAICILKSEARWPPRGIQNNRKLLYSTQLKSAIFQNFTDICIL